MRSTLQVYDLTAGARVVLQTNRLIEAPNWSPDGAELLVNCDGALWRVLLAAPDLLAFVRGYALGLSQTGVAGSITPK